MNTTTRQIRELFLESGYIPTEMCKDWRVSVTMPMTNGGTVSVCVGWDDGPDTVWVENSSSYNSTSLPFVSFEDFEVFFRAILKGCIKGPG
jgi:hypothetical protein